MSGLPIEAITTHNAAAQTEAQRRRVRVAQLLARKITQAEIAQQLNVDSSTISNDVKILMEMWREESMAVIGDHVAKEIFELDTMERDCMVQFLATQNPKWISLRLEIKDRKYKLLGLNAPEKSLNVDASIELGAGSESLRSRIDSVASRLRAGSGIEVDSTYTEVAGGTTI